MISSYELKLSANLVPVVIAATFVSKLLGRSSKRASNETVERICIYENNGNRAVIDRS